MGLTSLEDEHLEAVWLQEEKELDGLDSLKESMGDLFNDDVVVGLEKGGYLSQGVLTDKGRNYTSRLIRAHRLAERLLKDVLGITEFEVGACEFEHIINREILDGLCTLLGHPSLCPHGLPIPPGDCCRRRERRVNQAVYPLSSLSVGERIKVLYIQSRNDRELHVLESMGIRPGVTVSVHQVNPSLVVEAEGTHIAMDEAMAERIQGLPQRLDAATPDPGERPGHGGRGRRRLGRGRHGNRPGKGYTPE